MVNPAVREERTVALKWPRNSGRRGTRPYRWGTVLFGLGAWNRNTIPGLQHQPLGSQDRSHEAQKPIHEIAAVNEDDTPPRGFLFGNSLCALPNKETPCYSAGAFDGDNRLLRFRYFSFRQNKFACLHYPNDEDFHTGARGLGGIGQNIGPVVSI